MNGHILFDICIRRDCGGIQNAEYPADQVNRFFPMEGHDRIFRVQGMQAIFIYTDRINVRANCVFTVNGDSMEPAYHNGDLVLVERIPDGPDLAEGETGAFIVGNETYIKDFYEDGLHSLNPKYPVMTFHGEEAVYLIGRVLGILDPSAIAAETDVEKYMAIHPEES